MLFVEELIFVCFFFLFCFFFFSCVIIVFGMINYLLDKIDKESNLNGIFCSMFEIVIIFFVMILMLVGSKFKFGVFVVDGFIFNNGFCVFSFFSFFFLAFFLVLSNC